jgi:glycosyltransferase involved in cell wall biosynthesis
MNILLINHYAGSPRHGMEFRPYYLAREWIRLGHRVRILAGSYSHIRAIQPSLNRGPGAIEHIDGIEYVWRRSPSYRGNGLRRVFSMVSFIVGLWRDAQAIATDFRPDVVIASSTYPMDIWPAARIARCAGAQLVYEVHDLWPLSPMELGGMPWWHPFILWVQMAEDYAYKVADRVVSMLPKTLNYMASRGLDPAKWAYVPNGVDLEEWCAPIRLPDDVLSALHVVKARGQPVLGYAGTHGLANALDVLLDAASLLQGHLQILLVGTGPERERLIRRVESESLCNVTMLGAVPKAAMPALLEAFDLAFIGWHDNPLYRFGISPNKLLDYMMSSTPVIHAVSAGNDLVTEVACGISVPPNNPAAIADAALALCALTPGQRRRMGQKGQDYVRAERSYAVLARQFLDALQPYA